AAAQTRLREAERRLWEAEAVLKRLREALAALEEETQAEGIAAPVAIEPGDPALLARRVAEIKGRLASLPTVSPEVEAEYQEVKERHDFLATQREDLMGAEEALKGALARLRGELRRRFREALADVGARFQERFASFFGGGRARLLLTGDDEEAGVEIVAHPPGKSRQNLHLLSSGEKALTAVAFLFALLGAGPAPFCLLDEVDASLDEANVGRFVAALKELSQQTQFLVITHNRRTMEAADTIYGVTLGPEGSSRVLSLRLDEIA
ncbi:MAG TPA: AAA family ATPase, partial [Dehalococcoidia bacterium]|nr:AAA family ATPase [Dehalococcoidia bacterium]